MSLAVDEMALTVPPELPDNKLKVPMGRRVELPRRGRIFIRESGDPAAKHTVLLVHGWMASAGINWAGVFEPLGEDFRVVAADLRGHGRGIRSRRRFKLEDCADDLAVLIDELDCGKAIVVGYSMGGLVSQLLWRRHPERVEGIVLASTTQSFPMGRRERYFMGALMNYGAGGIRLGRGATLWYRTANKVAGTRAHRPRPATMRKWATAEIRRHDMRAVLQAGYATCQFDSKPWLGAVDVPAAVVVTTQDRAISPDVQQDMAVAIPDASVFTIDDDHNAFLHVGFPTVIVDACKNVAARIDGPVLKGARSSSS